MQAVDAGDGGSCWYEYECANAGRYEVGRHRKSVGPKVHPFSLDGP